MYGAKVWFAMVFGALLFAACGRPAAALEWDLEVNKSKAWELTFDAVGPDTQDIKLRGYYLNTSNSQSGDTGRFRTGQVQSWSGDGVGIWASDDGGSPNHAIDNAGKDNFLLVEFDSANYKLTAFQIGWKYTDADVEVWVGGADLGPGFSLEKYDQTLCGGNCDYSDLAKLGFTKVKVYYDVVVNAWVPVNTDVTGRYAIFSGQYTSAERNDNDYFKLSGIRAEEIEVPEPSSMLLLSSALAALGGGVLHRRWRRRAQSAGRPPS